MSYVFLSKPRTHLRKKRKSPQRSASVPLDAAPPNVKHIGDLESIALGENPGSVVRVGFTVFPIHTEKLNNLLIDLLQLTRSKCTSSDIIRIAIDELAQRPIGEVAELLLRAKRLKQGRPPKQKWKAAY